MATVYLARDIKHDRLVAVKVLHPDLAASLGADRFLREIQITAKLSHPHILPLFDSGAAGGFLYYVMPYVEGETLAEYMVRERQLAIREAVKISQEVAGALAHAHSYGLVHRDIKPSNIMMTGGHAVVADFGIARAIQQAGSEKLTHTGMAVGTPAYMSPEQAAGAPGLDGRSDLYSLGCVLYEMVVGQVPFTGPTPQAIMARHSMDHVTAPHIMRDTVPGELEEVMLTALAKAPADRYRTAQEFAEALAGVDTTSAVVRKLTGAQPRRRRQRNLVVPAAVALGAVVMAGAAWAVFGGSGGRTRLPESGLELRRIAVLYFDDLSPDAQLTPIADGLTEGLIDELGRVPGLSVISRNGVDAWRGGDVSPDSVARALGAGTLVVGSVAPVGERVQVTTRLVDGASGSDVGRRASFVLPRKALLSARDSVARDVSRILREWLGGEVELRERRAATSSLAAWTLVQRAERARKLGIDRLVHGDVHGAGDPAQEADSLLGEAARADPQWIEPPMLRGHVALLLTTIAHDPSERARLMRQGLEYAGRALTLAPGDARAMEVRGTLRYWAWVFGLEHDHARRRALLDSAEADLDAAVRADPSLASAHATLARLYYDLKDQVSAVLAARRAYETDAYLRDAARILTVLHTGSYNIMQFDEARRWCDEGGRRFTQDYRFVDCQIRAMTMPGAEPDVARAWRLAARLDSLAPASAQIKLESQVRIGGIIRRAGLADSAERVWQRVRPDDPAIANELMGLEAAMRAISGDTDGAMRLLKRYVAANPGHSFPSGMVHWWWRDLERHPEFRQVMEAAR